MKRFCKRLVRLNALLQGFLTFEVWSLRMSFGCLRGSSASIIAWWECFSINVVYFNIYTLFFIRWWRKNINITQYIIINRVGIAWKAFCLYIFMLTLVLVDREASFMRRKFRLNRLILLRATIVTLWQTSIDKHNVRRFCLKWHCVYVCLWCSPDICRKVFRASLFCRYYWPAIVYALTHPEVVVCLLIFHFFEFSYFWFLSSISNSTQ